MKRTILMILYTYKRVVSPLLKNYFGNACRFTPTCSEYSYQAVEKYGVVKGTYLAVKRIIKCHPFTKAGLDPLY